MKGTLVGVVGVGLAVVLGLRAFNPHVNEELKDEVVKQPQAPKLGRTLNVQAVVLDKVLLADELFVSGNVMPDEEVSLAFETSGKVTEFSSRRVPMYTKATCWPRSTTSPNRPNCASRRHN